MCGAGGEPHPVSLSSTQACPGWSEQVRSKTEQQALKEAEQLVQWCKQHWHGEPVSRHITSCRRVDPKAQKDMWRILKYLKEAAANVRGGCFPEAFKVLDDAFGAEVWRQKKGGASATEVTEMLAGCLLGFTMLWLTALTPLFVCCC